MFKIARPLFLHCETPLHVGSGDNLGIIDLPIQRERHTDFPKVESSSLKGSLREVFEEKAGRDNPIIHATFGYDEASALDTAKSAFTVEKDNKETLEKEFAGCLGFTDARLLLFPVKSMKGVFAWITCPQVLHKFVEEMNLCKIREWDEELKKLEKVPEPEVSEGKSTAIITGESGPFIKDDKGNKKIVLEEYAFDVEENSEKEKFCSEFANWLANKLFADKDSYWKTKISKDIVVLPNDDFKDFVNLSTEVITRTKIDNKTGTVAKGQLFTEEFLPTESIMYSLVLTSPLFLSEAIKKKPELSELSGEKNEE